MLSLPCLILLCSRDSNYSRKWLLFYQRWLFSIPVKNLNRLDQAINPMTSALYRNLRWKLAGLFSVQIS